MSLEENKAIVRSIFEDRLNKGEVDKVTEMTAPDFFDHDIHVETGISGGPADLREVLVAIRRGFPDIDVTVEDIIEEVVGEIADETDPAVAGVRRLANGDWWVRGHVPITDLQDYGLDLPVDSDDYNSVGGYVFGELGRLPKRGDIVRIDGYSLRVESVRENRVEAVRIRDHGRNPETGEIPAVVRPVEEAASRPRHDSPDEPEPREASEGA
jgi:hypothetical protein